MELDLTALVISGRKRQRVSKARMNKRELLNNQVADWLSWALVNNNNNNYNNWNLYSAISIHKMFKSAAHCHSLSHSQQRLVISV